LRVYPIHIAIRFSDRNSNIDTIAVHSRIIDKHGAVWFAKMGKTLAREHVTTVNAQCRGGIPTHLYLVQSPRHQVYRGELVTMTRQAPKQEKVLIPSYYEDNQLMKYMTLWSKISDLRLVDGEDLTSLYIAGSGSPLSEALHTSMAGMFIVRERCSH
jgi:hypothetical protein